MHLFATVLLSWVVPLVGCAVIGAAVFAVIESHLARRGPLPLRPIGLLAFAAGSTLFGLRLLNLFFLLLGSVRVSFRFSALFALILAGVSAYLLLRSYRRPAPPGQDAPNLLRSLAPRGNLVPIYGVIVGVALAVALATLASQPGAWDLFTHWLVVPHEILNKDHMAYLYGTTRTVAPGYPTHQVLLGALAMLANGGVDALMNGFSALFFLLAMLATAEAAWLLTESRLMALAAGLFPFALAGAHLVVFGFFYGDAMVITTIAFACLGLVHRLRNRARAAPVVAWIFVTMPIMSKGIGGQVAAVFTAIFLLFEGYCLLRKKDGPWHRPRLGLGLAAAFLVFEIGLPWLCNRNVVSNYTDPVLLTANYPSIWSKGAGLVGAFLRAPFFPLQLSILLGLAIPALGFIQYRRRIRSYRHLVGAALGLASLGVGLLLAIVLMLVPATKESFSRYTTMLGPIIALLVCVALGEVGTLKRWLGVPILALSAYLLLTSYIPDFVRTNSIWTEEARKDLPKQHREYVTNRAIFDRVKHTVDPVKGRVILIVPDKDNFIPFRIGLYFAIRNIKATLISEVDTSVMGERKIAEQVKRWFIVDRMRTPPPPELRPETDFLLFAKPTIVDKRKYTGLLAIKDLHPSP